MLKRKHTIVAAAALAAAPLAAKAATITYGYDTTVTYGTTSAVTGTTTATAAILNNQVTIPAGDFFKFNVNVLVTGNSNAAATGAYATNTSSGTTQPANLGLSAFGFAIADSAPTAVVPEQSGGNAVITTLKANNLNAYSSSTTGAVSTTTGQVGTVSAPLSGGLLAGSAKGSSPSSFYLLTLGANTTQDLFSGLRYQALTSAKTVLTPTNTATAYAVLSTAGSASSAPTYSLVNTTVNDTINELPALTINPATGGGGTTHNIVNLTSATQTGGNYGVQLASGSGNNQATFNPGTNAPLITVVSHGSGAYTPGAANSIDGGTGDATDFTGVTGFLAGDQEVYALKLKVGGATPTTTQINQIVTDISGQTGDGVSTVASLLSPSGNLATSVAAIFPGYDLMLTVASGSTTPFLGFDFSQETNVAGVTVTDIGAIPEPASAAMLLIGSSGLLMGRRKRALLKA